MQPRLRTGSDVPATAAGPSLVVDQALRPGHEPPQTAARQLRVDIQILRAWAVLTVIVNHARLGILPGGFLGVDIFFVISGYLMTGLIDEALANGNFSYRGFYARRVRRLLPAAYATLIAVALAAPWLLDATEYRNFVAQLAGGFSFTANMVLWKQADYFGTQAAMKPLLHIWSLSLEEQYYLLLPLALAICPRRLRLALSLALVAASGAICVAFMARSVSAAFYLLPSRAWELGIGSAVAMLVRRGVVQPAAMPVARWVCAGVLVALPVIAGERGHPGLPALAACLATAVLLVPGARMVASSWLRPLVAIGDRSYSLYLVHWPLLAFASNVFVDVVPAAVEVGLLALAFVATEIQYRMVEQRFRRFAITTRSVALLLLLPIAAVTGSAIAARAMATADSAARASGSGLSAACDFKGNFTPLPACMSGPAPRTIVWGDSFAMAVAPGMAAALPDGIVQATRTVCGPLLGLAPVNGALYTRAWGERCVRFNASVLDHLARHPEIRTVVLSSALAGYVPGAEDLGWRALVQTPAGLAERPQNREVALAALARTVAAIHALGRHALLVAPPPASGYDVARCEERAGEGRPAIAPHQDCRFTVAEYHAHRAAILGFLDEVRTRDIVPILDLDSALCRNGRCATRAEGTILYRDKDHLSGSGSRVIAREMNWGRLIPALAR